MKNLGQYVFYKNKLPSLVLCVNMALIDLFVPELAGFVADHHIRSVSNLCMD